MSDEGQEKQHDPSQRRIDEARRKGDIPRSAELTSAAGWFGFLLAATVFGPGAVTAIGNVGMTLLDQAHRLAPLAVASGRLPAGLLRSVILAIAPLFLLPLAMALLAVVAQRALILAPQRLMPDLSRLSPLANARQKFGRDGLVSFLQSTAKMCAVAAVLWLFLAREAAPILGSVAQDAALSAAQLAQILLRFLAVICAIAIAFGAVDLIWNRYSWRRRHMMSRQELADEMKDSDGDPHLRNHRRQRAREIANNRMLQDVSGADVVVVNPTHYAVALKWDRTRRGAPVCVAKGVDEIAARIRERASLAGVPIHPDPPTARALHATVEIGAQIRPEHYLAIAAAIRFADRMRKTRKGVLE